MFSTDTTDDNILKLPLWLLSVDDYANLLDVNAYSQIMVIEKMLNYVSLFAKNDEESNRYKNHLIATAITSVLYFPSFLMSMLFASNLDSVRRFLTKLVIFSVSR